MDRKRLLYLLIVIFMFVITTLAVCYFPSTIPVHFNTFGVDGKGKSSVLFSMPILALVIWIATPYLLKNSSFLPFKCKVSVLFPATATINLFWIIMCFIWLK